VQVGDEITVDDATIVNPDLSAGNGVVHAIDQLLVPADLDLTTPSVLSPTSATFDDGLLTLVGTVASEVERASLVATASDAVGSDNVLDQLDVDPDVGLDADTIGSLAQLVAAMPANLVVGVAGFDGTELYVTGTFIAAAERDAMTTIAESVGANADLETRPDATEADAVDLEAELNAFVADNPILFEPSSAVLSPSAFAVIDRIALEAQRFAGVAITVEGHTDSDGDATENLALSQLRAIAVSDALVERGIAEASITAQGFGSEQPVLVDGDEDKNASRRVEFRVVTTP
jgi:OOP family OmpA-OmpF porin